MNEPIMNDVKNQIHSIWDNYIASNQVVLDTKGNEFNNIDAQRLEAIPDILGMISRFQDDELNINEFKSALDGYNKRNNLWGFRATKGQMFFNQLVKNESNLSGLTALLKTSIKQPLNLEDALIKIRNLEEYTNKAYGKAPDKRKVAKPSSTGYFLSYFWQIHNPDQWPILYTSLIAAFRDIGLWTDCETQSESYESFCKLNDTVRKLLSEYAGKSISNWEAEHAFWNFKGNPNIVPASTKKTKKASKSAPEVSAPPPLSASFELSDYLFPKVANLVALGEDNDNSSAAKGYAFERIVAEVFELLDFDVDPLGQGKGRNPDAIVKCREQNTAFIVDAKAYSKGYTMGLDDRAIKEYILHHCPKLAKKGYKKMGFIIVSNSFNATFDGFINEITWDTDIRRFILLTTEALLYLLAFKMKDRLTPDMIIDKLIGCGNPIDANSVIQEFDDV